MKRKKFRFLSAPEIKSITGGKNSKLVLNQKTLSRWGPRNIIARPGHGEVECGVPFTMVCTTICSEWVCPTEDENCPKE